MNLPYNGEQTGIPSRMHSDPLGAGLMQKVEPIPKPIAHAAARQALEAVITHMPAPEGDAEAPLTALLVDSWYVPM